MAPDVDRFYRTLVRAAPDAIVYADSEGVITFWNKAAERIFGFSEQEAVGKTLDILIQDDLRQIHWDEFAETLRTERLAMGLETSWQCLHCGKTVPGYRSSSRFCHLQIEPAEYLEWRRSFAMWPRASADEALALGIEELPICLGRTPCYCSITTIQYSGAKRARTLTLHGT